jgi:hypothetical protein
LEDPNPPLGPYVFTIGDSPFVIDILLFTVDPFHPSTVITYELIDESGVATLEVGASLEVTVSTADESLVGTYNL